MEEKEIVNIAQDKQRNADLATLILQGGPFTKPEEVQEFMKSSEVHDATKNMKFYVEVQHVKNLSLSFPKSISMSSGTRGRVKTCHQLSTRTTSQRT